VETDATNPQSVYGKTKLAGEQAALNGFTDLAVVVRTSWLYSSFGNNFVKMMLRLGAERDTLNVVFDQIGTPTYAADLARAIVKIADDMPLPGQDKMKEIYHFSNEGVCSWYDFAAEIMAQAGLACWVRPIESKDYPTAAKRPFYSVLNKAKIKRDLGIEIRHWKVALSECLEEIG
jgi:dTDP-4-dehydrorhamnose reductase